MDGWLQGKLTGAMRLTDDLASHLPAESLRLDLPGLPSNTIGGQFWCLVGARESYARAIREGVWRGFTCSLADPESKPAVLAALAAARETIEGIPVADPSPARAEHAFALLEHEVQHHGQLIRFVYGNRLSFPASWKTRYTV